MPSPSKREAIVTEFTDRLRGIRVGGGFFTDAGLALFIGETPTLGPDDAPEAIAVLFGAERYDWHGKKVYITLPAEVHVIAAAGELAWRTPERLLADVKRAIEVDHDLAGLLEDFGQFPMKRGGAKPLPRESGSKEVGAVLPYDLSFTEGWGAP